MTIDKASDPRVEAYLRAVTSALNESGEPAQRIEAIVDSLREQIEDTAMRMGVAHGEVIAELDPPESFRTPPHDAPASGERMGVVGLVLGAGGVTVGQGAAAVGAGAPLAAIGDVVTLTGVILAIAIGAFNLGTRAGKGSFIFGVLLMAFIILAIAFE